MRIIQRWLFFLFGSTAVLLAACGGGGTSVQVSWTANREAAVNKSGGGYKVYYSKTPGFDIGSASSVNVPYQSGATAPTSSKLSLSSGTYYIKVVAYSSIVGPSGAASNSQPSAEVSVVVP